MDDPTELIDPTGKGRPQAPAGETLPHVPEGAAGAAPTDRSEPRRGRWLERIAIGVLAFLLGAVTFALVRPEPKPQPLVPDHPLSTVPDNFGEFDPALRKKVGQYKFPVDGELPAAQRVTLGGKVAVGGLVIGAVKIELRPLVIETESRVGEKRVDVTPNPALVLTLNIKNTSDLSLHPMDPAFTRRADPVKNDNPITRLVIDKQTGAVFAGGALDWPLNSRVVQRKTEEKQANDRIPLKPGEAREYVVFTDTRPNIIRAVKAAKDPMQWRVQVRRAPVELPGQEIPVTAIIGVDFRPNEIN